MSGRGTAQALVRVVVVSSADVPLSAASLSLSASLLGRYDPLDNEENEDDLMNDEERPLCRYVHARSLPLPVSINLLITDNPTLLQMRRVAGGQCG